MQISSLLPSSSILPSQSQVQSCSAVCTCVRPFNHLVLNLVWVKASFLNTHTLTLEVSAGSVHLLEERVRKKHTKWLLCSNVRKSKRMAEREKRREGGWKRACEGGIITVNALVWCKLQKWPSHFQLQPLSHSRTQTPILMLILSHILSLSCTYNPPLSFLFAMATRPNLWKVLAFIRAAVVRHPYVYTFAQVKRVLIDFTCYKQQDPRFNWDVTNNACQMIVRKFSSKIFTLLIIILIISRILLVQTMLDFCQKMHSLCYVIDVVAKKGLVLCNPNQKLHEHSLWMYCISANYVLAMWRMTYKLVETFWIGAMGIR